MWDWKDSLMKLNQYIEQELYCTEEIDLYSIGYNSALKEVQELIGYAIFGCDPEDGVDITQWEPNNKSDKL